MPNNSPALRELERYAKLLDSQFRIPGTSFRFGFDTILGLIPGAGDLITYAASGTLVVMMARHGASPRLVMLMLINVLLDTTLGAIPLLGDVFDFFFKANNRNIRLLREYHEDGKHRGSVWPLVFVVIAVLLLMGVLVFWLAWRLLLWLWELLSQGGSGLM